MTTFYGVTPRVSSPLSVQNTRSLGINTDNFAITGNKGSQGLIEKFKLLHHVRKILPKERTAKCFYTRISAADGVEVFLNKTRNKANYGNIVRCSNPWGCPVCASIISEGRKNEVKQAMDWWKTQGGSVLMLTLTAPHYSSTDISSLRPAMLKARKHMLKGVRATKDLFKKYSIQHYVSVFEVTYGENGFHPHFHILLFTGDRVSDPMNSAMRLEFYEQWVKACAKAKIDEPNYENGLTLQGGEKAASYISKWGLEHEITKGHLKKGKTGSKTPFDFLRDFAETGDSKSARLFYIYYYAFKGTRQLNWSQGLKKLSKVVEKTDEQTTNETDGIAELMFKLDIELWHPIRKHGKQGELLALVEDDHTLQKAMDFIYLHLKHENNLKQDVNMYTSEQVIEQGRREGTPRRTL